MCVITIMLIFNPYAKCKTPVRWLGRLHLHLAHTVVAVS